MFKNVARFLKNSTGKGVKKMKKLLIVILAILMSLTMANVATAALIADTVDVTATVAAGTNALTVTPDPWAWGSLPAATSTIYRFSSGVDPDGAGGWAPPGALSVAYFPAAPYEIRVSTDHNWTAGDKRGYLLSGTNKLYVKVWCQNFGAPAAPVNNGPNPMNSFFWDGLDFTNDAGTGGPDGDKGDVLAAGQTRSEATLDVDLNGNGNKTETITSTGPGGGYVSVIEYELGEAPSWLWVLEHDSMQEGVDGAKEYTRRRLVYNYPTDAELGSPFKVHMGMDLRSIKDGAYSGQLVFELYTY